MRLMFESRQMKDVIAQICNTYYYSVLGIRRSCTDSAVHGCACAYEGVNELSMNTSIQYTIQYIVCQVRVRQRVKRLILSTYCTYTVQYYIVQHCKSLRWGWRLLIRGCTTTLYYKFYSTTSTGQLRHITVYLVYCMYIGQRAICQTAALPIPPIPQALYTLYSRPYTLGPNIQACSIPSGMVNAVIRLGLYVTLLNNYPKFLTPKRYFITMSLLHIRHCVCTSAYW